MVVQWVPLYPGLQKYLQRRLTLASSGLPESFLALGKSWWSCRRWCGLGLHAWWGQAWFGFSQAVSPIPEWPAHFLAASLASGQKSLGFLSLAVRVTRAPPAGTGQSCSSTGCGPAPGQPPPLPVLCGLLYFWHLVGGVPIPLFF